MKLLLNNTACNQTAVRKLRFRTTSVLISNVKGCTLINKQNAPPDLNN